MTMEEKKPVNVEELAGKVDVLAKYLVDQEKRRAEPSLETGKGDDDDDGGGRRQRSRRSGGNPLLQIVVISAIVAGVVVMIMSSMGFLPFVRKVDDIKNIQGIIATIDKNKADLSATVEGLRVVVNNIPNTVATQVNTVMAQTVNQINAQIKTVADQMNSFSASVTAVSASVTAVDKKVMDNINALQVKIDTLTKISTDLQTANVNAQTNIKTLQETVTALKKTVDGLTSGEEAIALPDTVTAEVVSSSTIDDAEDYTITVTLNNTTKAKILDAVLELTLTPKSTGYLGIVDRNLVALDWKSGRPMLDAWDETYKPTLEGTPPAVTKRITFTSDEFDLSIGETVLKFYLTMAYTSVETTRWTTEVFVDY